MPIRSRDAPPFGLGLAPRHDAIGRLRDRLAGPLTVGTLGRITAKYTNPVRAELGLAPLRSLEQFYLAASVVLAYTAEPFEYPRSDWPAKVHLVGPGLWEPPAERPSGWVNCGSRWCWSPALPRSKTTSASPRLPAPPWPVCRSMSPDHRRCRRLRNRGAGERAH